MCDPRDLGDLEVELVKQHSLLGLRFGVPRHDEKSPIGGRQPNIDHLNTPEFIEHRARRQSGRVGGEPGFQRHQLAVTQERDEDVCLA
jgi:hypothetical protein